MKSWGKVSFPGGKGVWIWGHGGDAEHYAAWFASLRPQRRLQRSCSDARLCKNTQRSRPQTQQGMLAIGQSRREAARQPPWQTSCMPRWGTVSYSAGCSAVAWYDATQHHRLRTFHGTRASYLLEQAPQGTTGHRLRRAVGCKGWQITW